MSITTSKQKSGKLTLGTTEFGCQQKSVRIVPPEQDDDTPEEVLCGDVLEAEDEKAWKLALGSVQDWTDPAGFSNYTWTNHGQIVPFSWQPRGVSGPKYTGQVKVNAAELGGVVNRRLESESEWTITTGKPTRTEAV